ncbi:MAG: lysophospholipid acyltransferase family protein [Desulfuromonadaceae bacterium]|nr:lysophospholipid acyltransferase family protein [Desulfuromonadaceae bacterium]MDD2854379.1 lysophospholipid acyltransferase family protein [Desulfuromonadaceae bacterium]
MKTINRRIQAIAFYLFTLAVAYIPRRSSHRTGRFIGEKLYRILARRRNIAIDNITQALPYMKSHPSWSGQFETAEEIALATFINLGISVVEVCQLYHGRGNYLIDKMTVHGLDNFRRAAEKNCGVLCVSGHCGNWELVSLSFKKHLGHSVWAIARKQDNPFLNDIIEKMRMGYGNRVIYTKSALKQMLGVIRDKGVIGMLTDQAAGEQNGVLINFLGRKAWALKAPAVIAHKTGVPVIPVFGYRGNGTQHTITFHPEYTLNGDKSESCIEKDVKALSKYLEDYICTHPSEWYWIHRRWKMPKHTNPETTT